VRIARAGSSLVVELRAGGRRVGRLTRRSLRAGKVSFSVRARGRARRLTVQIAVTPPDAGPDRATRKVRLIR
jgi:hypothetical protein